MKPYPHLRAPALQRSKFSVERSTFLSSSPCLIVSLSFSLLLSLLSSSLFALPVDLSAPPGGGLGPTTDAGAAVQWVEMAEIDFGGGMTLPLRMSFLSSREDEEKEFGAGFWRTPLHDSRLMTKNDGRWPVLLPCGKIMSLYPSTDKPGQWATADGEWTAKPKGANTLVTRADGWELEFSAKQRLIRLRNDSGRNILWIRSADGSLQSLAEFADGKTLPPAYTVQRDATTGRVKTLKVNTRFGSKDWRYEYDASGHFTALTFPDTSVVKNTYGSREDGQPWISITGRDAIATTLTWHKDSGSLLHDGVWSYDIQPQPGNNPIISRTGPHGETESSHDDAVNHRTLFTAAEGTQTIKQRLTTGPAKGKLESIIRVLAPNKEPRTKNQEQVLYTATYDSRSLLESETNALGHKTTHTYTLHGTSVHTGIKTHTTSQSNPSSSDPSVKSVVTSQEFDPHGNRISQTNSLGHTFRQEYDAQNRLLKTTGPDGTVIESLSYTAQGQIHTRTDALGATTTYAYNAEGHRTSVTDPLGNVTKYEYDTRGNRTTTTDALGHTTRYEYDQGGRLTATILPPINAETQPQPGTTNQEPRTQYTYDSAGRKLTTTAPDGTVTEANTYDALGRLTARTNALGHTTRFEYDVKNGSTGCLSCSLSGLPTRMISPTGRITERTYDADRHLLTETTGLTSVEQRAKGVEAKPQSNAPGSSSTLSPSPSALSITHHTYDLAGNLLSTTDPLGRTTRFEYDAANNRTAVLYPDQSKKTFAYSALGQMIAETNELGHTTQREYDPYGNLIAVTDPEGHTTRTLYGSSGDIPVPNQKDGTAANSKTKNPEQRTKNSAFAALRRPTAIISPSGVTTAFHYDLLGRKLSITKAPGTPDAATTTYQYDAVGNEIASLSPTGIKLTHTYDARRRRVTTADALKRTWTFAYNDNAGPSGPAPCCGADPASNARAITTIHPDGTREEKIHNALGQLIETRDANVTTDNDQRRTKNQEPRTGVQYAYDEDGRLISLTDARGSVTKWRYDTRGKLAAKTYPDNTVEAYEHDAAGQLVSRLRPNGVTATNTYDLRGRLLTIQWSDGTTENSTFAYDAAGHMILAENRSAKITRTYNPAGKMDKEVQSINYATVLPADAKTQAPGSKRAPFIAEVGYDYTADGQLSQLTYPDKTTVSYHYNTRGELASVQDSTLSALSPSRGVAAYTRRSDGKITQLTLPNGTVTHKSYDAVGRLSEIRHVAPDKTVLFSETSRYDDRNRRTARLHEDGTTDLFAYDPAGQVTAAAYGEAAQSGTGLQPVTPKTGAAATSPTENSEPRTANFKPQQTFAYDPAGNRQSFQDIDGAKIDYTANEANQYTAISESAKSAQSADEPRYDKLGNLLVDYKNSYTWDADIHLMSVTTKENKPGAKNQEQRTDFKYDALHRRVARHEGASNTTTLFSMDGWNVICEFSASSSPKVSQSLRLVWSEDLSGKLQGASGIGGLVSTTPTAISNPPSSSQRAFFHYDSNGNVIVLSDKVGNETARYQYDSFGKSIMARGAAADLNRYQFSTKPIENVASLAYYGYRYYSAEAGRWISKDPRLDPYYDGTLIKNMLVSGYGELKFTKDKEFIEQVVSRYQLVGAYSDGYSMVGNNINNKYDFRGLLACGGIIDGGLDIITEVAEWTDYFGLTDTSCDQSGNATISECNSCCAGRFVGKSAVYTAAYACDSFESVAEGAIATPVAGGLAYAGSTLNYMYHQGTALRDLDICETSCKTCKLSN